MKKLNLLLLILCYSSNSLSNEALEALGERLFNDERFSEYFYSKSQGNVNYTLKEGSEELHEIEVRRSLYESPFKGTAMTCGSCHMVDQAFDLKFAGMRGYNDFSIRTKLPLRLADSKTHTLRNTPALIGIGSKYAVNRISHVDGEFFDHGSTVLGNFLGRNMGWLSHEKDKSRNNIIKVIKEDDGSSDLAQEFGGAYAKVILGIDPSLPDELRIPELDRFDVYKASNEKIINIVIKAVSTYMNGIDFEKDEDGEYIGSPYDKFLMLNNIPRGTKLDLNTRADIVNYTRELIQNIQNLKTPKFVKSEYYSTHKDNFEFGPKEFEGLKLFFNLSKRSMCVNCHLPPLFTDQIFHNIGSVQIEYDSIHGEGSFNKVDVPKLEMRGKTYFLDRPDSQDIDKNDLGVWNFYARSGKEKLTKYITDLYCGSRQDCDEKVLLPHMIARFKTPTLRNLNHSDPYLYNGSAKDLSTVLEQYLAASELMKKRTLRNGAPQLNRMTIDKSDLSALEAFLNALNEEYE